MANSRWRAVAAPIIAQIIAENKGVETKVLRKLFRENYPFRYGYGHPRKMWNKEINHQLGLLRKKPQPKIENQKTLFDGI